MLRFLAHRFRHVGPQTLPTVGAWLVGCAVGAGLMALLDPVSGRRRRAQLQQQLQQDLPKNMRRRWRRVEKQARFRAGQLQGTLPRRPVRPNDGAHDEQLIIARVRACLGHICEDAPAIDVRLEDGIVELHGPVARRDRRRVVRAVRRVIGVAELHCHLQSYDSLAPQAAKEGHATTVH